MTSRRKFIKNVAASSAALAIGGLATGMSAKSYRNIVGANERINVAMIGVNSRGKSMSGTFASQKNTTVACICDVDERAIPKAISAAMEVNPTITPKSEKDCRKVLEDKTIDAIYIATPDHWHAPLTIMGCQAGKHVYVEKPVSHNPHEGELAIAAARKYNRVVQMGAQRRSAPILTQGIEKLHQGIIGRVYTAKTWYTNARKSTFLTPGTVPTWLDYDLWQGPAPRIPYKEGLIHYNWHWFWHWGTGEALNNGTHMIDLLRWGLGVDYPVKVSSNGGRFHFKDDWETPDTQVINLDFKENVSMTWEGRSCNGRHVEGSSVGVEFYGENGSLVISGGNEYKVYDLKNKIVKEVKDSQEIDPRDAANPAGHLDALHIRNLFSNIYNGETLKSDIDSGHKSTLLVQLGNIAQRVGHSLEINPENGRIVGDKEAQKLWSREYEKGWEMKL